MHFVQPIDRNVCSFLSIYEFICFRKTCRCYYYDAAAYDVRAWSLPLHLSNFSSRQTIALHYLMSFAVQFEDRLGSVTWYQRVVNWLRYKPSIKIMYAFICVQNFDFLFRLTLSDLSACQRFCWLRLLCRNQQIQKRRLFKYARYNENESVLCDNRGSKRRRCWDSSYGDLQPCY